MGEGADMGRGRYSVLTGALELAVLFFPLLSISDLVVTWYPFDTTVHYILAGWLLPAVSGLLCFCVLVSESAKAALKKWALSIPFTVIFWLALAVTDFEVRLTNTLYPGYGSLSAGGGLALVMNLGFFGVAQGAAILLAVCVSGEGYTRRQRLRFVIQNILLPTICIAIFAVVVYLEFTMPTWDAIYRAVYS